MRRLSLLLCALFLAVVASAPKLITAKPVLAASSCGYIGDAPGTIYFHAYGGTTWQVHDSWPSGNPTHNVSTDVAFYRLSGGFGIGQDGHCYRAYYTSAWADDRSGGHWHPHLRTWVCGRGPYQWDNGETGLGAWRADLISVGAGWQGETTIAGVPSDGPAAGRLLDFADYGLDTSTCRAQVDQFSTGAWSPTWSNQIQPPWTDVWSASDFTTAHSYQWYCHEYIFVNGNDVRCGDTS